MKNRVLLLAITIVAVAAMAVVLGGCGCGDSSKETKLNPNNVPTDDVTGNINGFNVVNDEFETISPTQKTTDAKGNTVISYTDSQGNKVIRTVKKNGTIHIVVKNKKGKIIKDKTYKDKIQNTTKQNKKNDKKENKKDDGEHVGAMNDEEGWSDFY